jgi:glycosyltransferase involved in cell wall biosynthesis
MKILSLELSGIEPITQKPGVYGAVGPTLYRIKSELEDFWIAARSECFQGEYAERNIYLQSNQVEDLRNGVSLESVVPDSQYFDLIFHCNPGVFINTEIPQLAWCVGFGERINPKHKNILFHNFKGQKSIISNLDVCIHEFVLGVPIPEFEEHKKEDFIFQCSNHYWQLQSHLVAAICSNNKIQAVFAGPVAEDYKEQFFKYIDEINTTYIGEIKEEVKILLNKKAKMFSLLYAHGINETPLSAKASLSLGCPILTTRHGHMVESIKEGVNGFFVENERQFLRAWENRDKIKQKDCWDSVQKYSVNNMVSSLKIIFERVYGN